MTNGESDKQRNKINRFGLEAYFKAILIEEELGFGKPVQEVYLRAMEEMDLGSEDVWAVGDHLEFDVLGPQKLGIFAIWNDYAKEGLPSSTNITDWASP